MSQDTQRALMERAARVLPGGSFGNMAGDIVVREGRGGRIWDEDGKAYIDYLIGSGPMLVGHAHPEVLAATEEQVRRGSTFFANNAAGIRLAEMIVEAVPCAEQVRFVSSGTEADLYAMRLARAYRGRDKIVKFEGGYHGMSDYGLMSLAPNRLGNFPRPVPDSAGIPRSVEDEVLVAPYNDLAHFEALLRDHHDEVGGVIVEPVQRLLPPVPGFLEGVRRLTEQYGIPLIFDEVVTGFRLAYGGGQEFFGITPDLCTLGKACGGGFPLAAVAGKSEIMSLFDKAKSGEDRFVKQIGTLSGNPVAAAAGVATLEILKRPGSYEQLRATGEELMSELGAVLRDARITAQVIGIPAMFDAVFADGPVRDYRDTLRSDARIAGRLNALLRERGILKGESKYYVSLAHDADCVQETVAAWRSAVAALTA